MNYYADSSFLVSCYIADASTEKASTYLSSAGVPLVYTALHDLEIQNAFELGVFRGLLTTAQANAASSNLKRDIQSGRLLKMTSKWGAVFRSATDLSRQHSAIFGARSIDILHVAAAKSLRAVAFISFDTRQRGLAKPVGLRLAP